MNKRIVLLMMIQVFIYLGFGIIIPVIPEIVSKLDTTSVHLGGLLAIYSLSSFITAPFWGGLSDRFGRKSMMLIGLMGYSLSFILFGLFLNSLAGLYASRVLGGIFSGALYSATISYVADNTNEDNRTKYMGFIGISIGVGFILGPSIGGFLSTLSLTAPFYTSAGLLLLLFILTWRFLPDSIRKGENAMKHRLLSKKQWGMLRSNQMIALLSFTFIATLLMAGLESTFQLFEIKNIGITPVQIGLLFMISGFADAIVQGAIIPFIKRGQEARWIIAGQIASGAALLLIPFTQELWIAGAALALFSAGNALVRTCTISLITLQAEHQQGLASGISYSLDSLGRIIGPLAFTFLLDIHAVTTFIVLSFITFFSIILMVYFENIRSAHTNMIPQND
ncbi:MFS transporter [Sutcliffiella horikoshii]|uniref:MFS transporter n=1 Tax=Sutcliffiella horikoshii TaxID=79883 RepID=UPI001CFF1086|nr:MFS transporter [Sutcliffiella horikoshii]